MAEDKYQHMVQHFAQRISPNNIFEAATIVVSGSGSGQCEWHRDMNNGDRNDQHRSVVLSWNMKLGNGHAISVIFYMRASVEAYCRAVQKATCLTSYLTQSYADFPLPRRFLSRQSLNFPTPHLARNAGSRIFPGNGMFRQVETNLDPMGFTSLGIVCIVTLIDEFRLNMADSMSLFVAFAVSKCSSMEGLAKTTLEWLRGRRPESNCSHQLKIGYEFHLSMWRFWSERNEQQCFHVRFNDYKTCGRLPFNHFVSMCEDLFWFFMLLWNKHPKKPSPGNASRVYQDVLDSFSSIFPGVGKLQGRHLLAMSSVIGFSPPWIQECAAIDYNGKSWLYLRDKFSDIPCRKPELRKFTANLFGMLKFKLGVCPSIVENLCCKSGQREKAERRGRQHSIGRDLHHIRAPLVVRGTYGLEIAHASRNSAELPFTEAINGGSFITAWPLGPEGEFIDIPDVASRFGQLFADNKVSDVPRSYSPDDLPAEALSLPCSSPLQFELGPWWKTTD